MSLKKPKDDNYIGFRLPENVLKKLDIIAKQERKSRGLLAKEGLQEWVDLQLYNQNNNIISISKTFFIHLISYLDYENMNKLAINVGNLTADILRFLVAKPMNSDTLRQYAQFSIKFFGKRGLRWFNILDIEVIDSKLIFRGIHDLQEKFSDFFTHFYKYLLNAHFNLDFITSIEEITPGIIHLEFKLREEK